MAAFGGRVFTRRVSLALGQQQSYQAQVLGETIQPTGLHGLGETVDEIQSRFKGLVADRLSLRPGLQYAQRWSRLGQLLMQKRQYHAVHST